VISIDPHININVGEVESVGGGPVEPVNTLVNEVHSPFSVILHARLISL